MEYIEITLPMPPSLNCLFAGMKRRYKSNVYEKWLNNAEDKFEIGINDTISGDEWLNVNIDYYFPLYTKAGKKKIKDAANYEKATIDFLCNKIQGLEDHKIKIITQEKHDSKKDIVKIRIQELDNISS